VPELSDLVEEIMVNMVYEALLYEPYRSLFDNVVINASAADQKHRQNFYDSQKAGFFSRQKKAVS
jgi:hypothetical protein